ncbi:MAG: Fic family protein, partial [Prevotella intermedia]
GLSWDQVETKSGLSWEEVEKLFFALQQPKLMRELKEIYGWKNTTKFKTKYVEPLLDNRLVRMTIPSKPTSSKQRYYLTDLGKTLFANELNTNNTARSATDNINRLIESLNENEKRIAFELLKKHK